jgi:hypothetical protein
MQYPRYNNEEGGERLGDRLNDKIKGSLRCPNRYYSTSFEGLRKERMIRDAEHSIEKRIRWLTATILVLLRS